MNFASTSGAPSGFGPVAWSDIGSPVQRGDSVTIADAHLLFSGDYERAGSDLIVSDHLHRVVVSNYFHGDKRPALVSSEGVALDPKVIEALTGHAQYAQAGPVAAAKVIGHVVKMTGSASIVRNGVTIDVGNGDVVYQNDVVQTGSGSTLGLVLIDGTTFNLTANARLMMNDLTYDPAGTSNTSLFTLVQGAANFVAGQVAKTGDMKVSTPVATMGIRGTAVILDVSAVDGRVSISVVNQRDGQLHAIEVYNTRGDLIGTVTSNGSILTLTPTASFEVIAQESSKTVAQVITEFNAFQQLLSTYEIGKQLVPDTPAPTDGRRGDATPQTTTKFAGTQIVPSDSSVTKFNAEIGSLKGADGGVATGDLSTLHATADGPGVTRIEFSSNEIIQPQVVEVPATSIPFVVTPSPVSRISSGAGDHFGPVMSADGQFVTYDPDGSIFLFDRQSGTTKTIASPQDGFTYGSPTISADGRFIVYQGSDGGQSFIFIYNNDASDPAHYGQTTRLMAGGQPAISGDGSRIVIEQGGSIGLYDQQGHQLADLMAAALGISGTLWKPAISADGHIIAFWSSEQTTPGGAGQLFTYDLSSATLKSIASTATDAGDSAASFSANGRYVVYQSDAPGGHSEIYLTDLQTGAVIFHTANADASYNPVISPDGHFIIFPSDARLTGDDTNNFTDVYVVDVTDPAHPVYKLVSVLDDGTQGNAASNLGATISAGGQFVAFGSSASNFSTGDTNGGGDIFVVDPSSGHSAIILEGRNSPAVLTASGIVRLTGEHNGVTLGVSDSRIAASFDADGNIRWSFSEARSDFAALQPGEIAVRNFVITLGTGRSTTEIPVKVSIYDVDQTPVPVADAAPVASPVTLTAGTEDAGYTVTSEALLAGVVDIDGPSLSITGLSVSSGGGTIVDSHDGTFHYSPAANYNGPVAFNYTVSDGTLSASSTAHLELAAVNDAPVMTKAAFAVSEGGTVVLTPSDIAVSDVDDASATFTVSGVSHGKFQTSVDGTNWVDATTFTTAQLGAGHVRFVHDGGEAAPAFSIQADDGHGFNRLSATVSGTVNFTHVNDAPILTNATLTVSEGAAVALDATSLAVSDPDSASFIFAVSGVSHGTFETTTDGIHWSPATTFSSADLEASHVRFVHDGGEHAPTFSVQVDDGAGGVSDVVAGTVNFSNVNDAPVITQALLTVSEGGTVVLGASDIVVSDPDSTAFTFTVSNLGHGRFQITADGVTWTDTLTFTNGDLGAKHVRFVHDGGEDAPTFSLQAIDRASDHNLSNVLAATVTFTNANDAAWFVAGGDSASMGEDDTARSGVILVDDPDQGENHTKAASGTTALGSAWSIDASGHWTYTLNNAAVQHLGATGSTTDKFTVASKDGTAHEDVTITINGANDGASFVAGGDSASMGEDDTAKSGNILVHDPDDGENHTVSASGTTALGSAWSIDASGHWTYTLNKAAVQHLGVTDSTTDSFTVHSQDGTAHEDVTITINGVNDAPSIAAQTLASIKEDDAGPSGRSVLDIFGTSFDDVDEAASLKGIAVIGDDSTANQGFWQYRSSGGNWEAIGQVDPQHALIFAADTDLRFVPATDFNGTPGSLHVVGIDDSYDNDFTTGSAQAGGRYTEDVSVRGGSTPFSDQAVTLGVSVTPVNDAPLAAGAATLSPIDEDTTCAPGDTIANLFGANFSDAADEQTAASDGSHANAFAGIAISDYTPEAAKGEWQYATSGSNWTTLGATTASAAITLSADVALRFVPAADYNGSATALGAHLIESGGAAIVNGGTIDVTTAGASTHYSAATVALGETINQVNDAPVIDGDDSVTIFVPENTTAVETVVAHDVDGQQLTYSILTGSGSPDASKFSIGSTSGALSFKSAPDFGHPTDSNHNNIYSVQVKVSDGTLSDVQTLHVQVTDVNDNAPVITTNSSQLVAENHTLVTQLSAFDVDTTGEQTTFSISDGLDGGLFEIVDGTLQFRTAPDFENPADGNHDNIYSVTVNASDGLNSSSKTLFVQVTNVNEAPVLAPDAAAVTYTENAAPLVLIAGGTVTDPDNPSNFEGGSFSVTLNGAQPGDELVIAGIGGVSLSGSSIKVSGTTVGTVSGNHSTQLTIAFNSNATDARVETVLHAVAFDSTSDNPGNAGRTATVTFNDGSNDGSGPALTDSSTVTIHVAPINDAPHAVNDAVITNNAANSTYLVPGWALLANDTDPDSPVLGVSGVSHASGFSTTNPLILTAAGDVTIHDDASVGGSFDYTASDGSSNSTAHVTVTLDSGDMSGGSGNEIFIGNSSGSTINGNGGDDILIGNAGNDTLDGGPGNDIYAFGLADGSDTINHSSGVDSIRIAAGGATLNGLGFAEDSHDNLVIQFNGQQITVTNQFDDSTVAALQFAGGASYAGYDLGGDLYSLSDDSGSIRNGTSGNDVVSGDGNANITSGGDGNDLLFGNGGNDTLNGGSGNDLLVGGAGDDLMSGGPGNDIFVVAAGSGHDTIADFIPGQDKISLDYHAFDAANFSSWLTSHATSKNNGHDVLIDLNVNEHSGVDTMLLQNVGAVANLHAADFIVH